MEHVQQAFSVRFEYKVYFTEHLFHPHNSLFRDFLNEAGTASAKKIFFVIDEAVAEAHPRLRIDILDYFSTGLSNVQITDMLVTRGGEQLKNSQDVFYRIANAVDKYGIDRHSYIAAIGGGSVLDVTGFAASVAHRGVRHIRIPTTVLSQNDSGVGVKNGMNYLKKKNFLGTFAPPAAVFNDFHFLTTLDNAEWRSGIAEAVKVALIKDKDFYQWLVGHTAALTGRKPDDMKYLIRRCAELHINHIAGGDAFEMGSSRPLDFGHWSAHKIEQLSDFRIRHGEAVAMGIALDSAYSLLSGRLTEPEAKSIISLLQALGFAITHPLIEIKDGNSPLLAGLNEFREHLGGELTVMLLNGIGSGEEVHELDTGILQRSSRWLQDFFN